MSAKIAALCASLSFVFGSSAAAQVTVQSAGDTVPTAFQGEWRADLAGCGGAPDDTSLMIEAGGVRLRASQGALVGVMPRGPSDVVLLVKLDDGSKSWNSAIYLNLSADGTILTDVKNQFARHRCPAK